MEWTAANGTTWWIERGITGIMQVFSFQGGPWVMTIIEDLAPLEVAAMQELVPLAVR